MPRKGLRIQQHRQKLGVAFSIALCDLFSTAIIAFVVDATAAAAAAAA